MSKEGELLLNGNLNGLLKWCEEVISVVNEITPIMVITTSQWEVSPNSPVLNIAASRNSLFNMVEYKFRWTGRGVQYVYHACTPCCLKGTRQDQV